MEIIERKITANFSEEEFNKIDDIGQIIGSMKKSFESGEITELTEDAINILTAIKNVIDETLSFTK